MKTLKKIRDIAEILGTLSRLSVLHCIPFKSHFEDDEGKKNAYFSKVRFSHTRQEGGWWSGGTLRTQGGTHRRKST